MLDYMTVLHLRFKSPSQWSQDLKQQVTILHRQLTSRLENLNEKQLDTFMDVIRQDAIWYDFFYTELTIGLRQGEICGLMWSDFDAHSGILKINRTLYREKGEGWWLEIPRLTSAPGKSSCLTAQPSF